MKPVKSKAIVAFLAALSMSLGLFPTTSMAQEGPAKLIHPADAPTGPKRNIPACLDWDTNAKFKSPDWDNGYRHYGSKLHVYDDCIPDANQVWYLEGSTIATYVPDRKTGEKTEQDKTKFCMDLNRGDFVEGKGYGVIGWDDCHGADIQQWTIRDDGTITVDWDGRRFCLDWDEDQDSWHNEVFAAECTQSSSQKWVVVDRN